MKVLLVALTVLLLGFTPIRAQESITIGVIESLDSLDPAEADDLFSWEILTHLYTGLTRQIPGTTRYELALADWHGVTENGLTHYFTIRPDAMFNDGTPITTEIVVDSIKRALEANNPVVDLLKQYILGVGVNKDPITPPYTFVEIALKRPMPYLFEVMSLPPFFPYKEGATNGMYKVEAFQPRQSLTLIPDPAWQGEPATTPIIIRRYDHPADVRRALNAGEIGVAHRALSDAVTPIEGASYKTYPGTQVYYMLFQRSRPPFNDPAARRSMAHMMDRANTAGMPLASLFPPQVGEVVPFPEFTDSGAAEVLAAGGYGRYKRIEGEVMQSTPMYGEQYSRIMADFNRAWSRQEALRINRADILPDAFFDALERATFQAAVVGWTPLVPHPVAYLEALFDSRGMLARAMSYSDPSVDALIAMGDSEAVQRIALEDMTVIPLWQGTQIVAARDEIALDDVVVDVNYLLRYDTLHRR
jgi:ABC-type transport system substrate-binding protein